jgi:invasion protein IalB
MTRNRVRILAFSAVALVTAAAGFYALADNGAGATGPANVQLAQASPAATPAVPSTLPGGASSIDESYRDWRVGCAQQGTAKRCALSQVLARQDGQRVLAVTIDAPQGQGQGKTVTGALVLPFGLALDAGAALQIDDKPALPPLRFRTCLPAGCVAPLSFDAAAVAMLRAGTSLKVTATADGGGPTQFAISLAGFGPALDRAAALAR